MHPNSRPLVALLLVVAATASAQGDAAFERDLAPFLRRWCTDCHAGTDAEAGLDLEQVVAARATEPLRAVRERLRVGEMPPLDAPRPADAERLALLGTLDALLTAARPSGPADPGRVTMRRLSRTEYENTIRDLLGVRIDVGDVFPVDDLAYGFDNIGDALSFSLLHLEKYAEAAERIAAAAIDVEDPEHPVVRRFECEEMESTIGDEHKAGDAANLFRRATLLQRLELPRDGDYRLRVFTWGDQAGGEPARLAVTVDEARLEVVDVPETRDAPKLWEKPVRLAGGLRVLRLAFVNDYYEPDDPDPAQRDRNLHLDWLEVVGPVDAPSLSDGHRWIFAADPRRGKPATRARRVMKALASRAWRRPTAAAEELRLAKLVTGVMERGGTFAEGVRLGLSAVLTSPNFVFRVEEGGRRARRDGVQDLPAFQLASRLSYFVWSSMPDPRLLELARKRRLTDPGVLEAEVRRMLEDPRASALATNFAAQWLELRNLADAAPDPARFPGFDDELRDAMRRESELFFEAVLRENLPVTALLSASFSFLNEPLARHYGITGVRGAALRRVALQGNERAGLLTHASVLTVTSNPTRTSPVKRGKWILENVLGTPPPPPPPGVDSLEEGAAVQSAATLREQLERHRSDPACASCHARMDALGFALENFDAVGRWRERDGDAPIDASGSLPDGRRIGGVGELRTLLTSDAGFVACLAEKLFTYAIGREASAADEDALAHMIAGLGSAPTLRDIIVGIVGMDAFRRRRVGRKE